MYSKDYLNKYLNKYIPLTLECAQGFLFELEVFGLPVNPFISCLEKEPEMHKECTIDNQLFKSQQDRTRFE
jgi:hypothetical protein